MLVLSFLFVVRTAAAQVTFDAATTQQCGNNGPTACTVSNTTITVAHTTGAGSNRAMTVGVFIACASGQTAPLVATATYATTQVLSQIQHTVPNVSRVGDLWALPAGTQPTSGANNLVVVMTGDIATACSTGTSTLSVAIITTAGVDQTTTFTSSGVNSGTGTAATLTLGASGASDLGVSYVCAGDGVTSTTETERGPKITNQNNSCGTIDSATAAAADTSLSWTIPSDTWIVTGGALKAVGAAGSTACRNLLLLGVGGACS